MAVGEPVAGDRQVTGQRPREVVRGCRVVALERHGPGHVDVRSGVRSHHDREGHVSAFGAACVDDRDRAGQCRGPARSLHPDLERVRGGGGAGPTVVGSILLVAAGDRPSRCGSEVDRVARVGHRPARPGSRPGLGPHHPVRGVGVQGRSGWGVELVRSDSWGEDFAEVVDHVIARAPRAVRVDGEAHPGGRGCDVHLHAVEVVPLRDRAGTERLRERGHRLGALGGGPDVPDERSRLGLRIRVRAECVDEDRGEPGGEPPNLRASRSSFA